MKAYGVSIIICCHNGEARLPETIKHICMQQVPAFIPWELVIVDNDSTDQTAAVAENEWRKYSPAASFRIVREEKLGLNYARTRGFQEAAYEFMLMCDDDNWLSPTYVSTVFNVMSVNPRIGALGGHGILLLEIPVPEWFLAAHIFASGPQGQRSGKVTGNRVYGAGCVIRKSAYQRLSALGFRTLLTDRKGKTLTSGGDYELCYALAILGYDIWYDERLAFTHFITKERLTPEYFIRYAKESSKCAEVLFAYQYIAGNFAGNEVPALVIARNYFYFLRKYLRINLNRLKTSSTSEKYPVLLFKHIALQSILFSFTFNLRKMFRVHRQLLDFSDACSHYRMMLKDHEPKVFTLTVASGVQLKPFRQYY
jgi:glycosyltransferase involved in cell wall biosynthesis